MLNFIDESYAVELPNEENISTSWMDTFDIIMFIWESWGVQNLT